MTSKHDYGNKKLEKYIKEERVVFLDNKGIFHKVYNDKDGDLILREGLYFKNYEAPSMCNTDFPCKKISQNFKALCNFSIADKNEMTNGKCKRCLFLNTKDLSISNKFISDNTLIPDISISDNYKYKYWIEGVTTHPCTDYKFNFVKNKDFDTLEFSTYDLNLEYERIVPVFNLKTLTAEEYLVVKDYYKIRTKDEESVELRDLLIKYMLCEKKNLIESLDNAIKMYKEGKKINEKEGGKITDSEDHVLKLKPILEACLNELESILSLAKPRLGVGESLCLESVLKMIVDKYDLSQKENSYIRNHLISRIRLNNYSIADFTRPSYKEEIVKHFKLKRRTSIIDKSLLGKIKEYKKHIRGV